MRSARDESNLGKSGLLGSDGSSLGAGSLLRSDPRRLSAREEIDRARQAEQAAQIHQQNIARSGSEIAKVTVDNDDGTYSVQLAGGGATLTGVAAEPGSVIPVGASVVIEREGPGWRIRGLAPYGI